jgi:hypothetical protein
MAGFENAGWDVYFDRLRGSNEEIVVEFAFNLGEEGSRVRGIEIPVIEESHCRSQWAPSSGQRWFSRRTSFQSFLKPFCRQEKVLLQKG